MTSTHSVFVIDTMERKERRIHIIEEFTDRKEFPLEILCKEKHRLGNVGLWENVVHHVAKRKKLRLPYIVICEDDHIFTKDYDEIRLMRLIDQANKQCADILLGGVSWCSTLMVKLAI